MIDLSKDDIQVGLKPPRVRSDRLQIDFFIPFAVRWIGFDEDFVH